MAKLISNIYGDALFEIAKEKDKVDVMLKEASWVLSVFEENKDLCQVLSHPMISKDEKKDVVENIFKGNTDDDILGLLLTILDKGREKNIKDIFEYFISIVKEYKKIGIVYVTTAISLSDERKKEIEKKLIDTTEYESLEMNYNVDKEIIGGMIIRIKDRIVDSSIKNKIDIISKDLHSIQLSK